MTSNYVLDEEALYRNVRGGGEDEYRYDETGQLIISNNAFLDRNKKPSVDRAKLNNFDPEKSRMRKEDGIVTLIAQEVRQIGDVRSNNGGGSIAHAVDVSPDPVPRNKAHAQITVEPDFFGSSSKQKKAFKLLRIALARLATQNGWTLNPS